jgi:predicted DCC family thiol-disulfide oxidoreductase YuxK
MHCVLIQILPVLSIDSADWQQQADQRTVMKLTIFYDSLCPLCSAEIKQLKALDTNDQLSFEDIHALDFIQRYPYVDQLKAYRILHGQLSNGDMIYGLDVTCLAWKTVGKHRWLAILRWPLIRWFADMAYLFFARYRNTIASLFTTKVAMLDCQRCKPTE